MAGWDPIVPRKQVANVANIQRKLFNDMSVFLIDANRMCADYEAPPSESYVRTNTLKRSWRKEGPKWEGHDLVGIVTSAGNIAPYNVYVRGSKHTSPGQARAMARRGWLSIDQILAKLWPPQKQRFEAILRGH